MKGLNRYHAVFFMAIFSSVAGLAIAQAVTEDSKKAQEDESEVIKNTTRELADGGQEAIIEIKETIAALGWEKELAAEGGDLAKFGEKYPKFKPLIQSKLLLTISENLFDIKKDDKLEKEESFIKRHWGKISFAAVSAAIIIGGYIGGKAGYESVIDAARSPGVSDPGSMTLGLIFAPLAAVVGAAAGAGVGATSSVISTGAISIPMFSGNRIKEALQKRIWGPQISFADLVDEQKLKGSSAYLYCQNLKSKKAQFWLDDGYGDSVKGTWGVDEKTKLRGFAVQESPLTLLKRCAAQMRSKFQISKLNPDEVLPTIGISLFQTKKLYAKYPIIYYTNFSDEQGKAGRLSYFFSKSE